MDFEKYRGRKIEDAKKELEEQGFRVAVVENYSRELEGSEHLVVLVKETKDKSLVIIAGAFKFLS